MKNQLRDWDQRLGNFIAGSIFFTAATTPFLFSFATSELFEFNKMVWVYTWTVILVGLWLMRMVVNQRWLLKPTPLDLPISLFIISQIISTILSIHPQTSIFGYYSRFHGGLLSTLSYVVWFYALVTHLNFKQFKLLVLTILMSGALASWYAIPEEFSASFSCIFADRGFTTECWSENTNPKYRIFGTFGQPNWLAAYLVTLLPLGLYQVVNGKNYSRMSVWLVWLGSITAAIIFTKSRSGFLGMAVGLLLFVVGWGWINKNRWQTRIKQFLLGIGVLILSILLLGSPFTPSLKQAIQSITQPNQNDPSSPLNIAEASALRDPGGTDSGEIRKIVWSGALKVWQRYPWFGSGVETFAYSYYLDRPIEHNYVSEWDYLYNKAHNEFLNFLATTGIFGLLSYLTLLGSSLWLAGQDLLNKKQVPQNKRLLSLSLASSIVGLSVTNFFGFSTVSVNVIMFCWLAGISIIKSPDPKNFHAQGTMNSWQWFGIGLISIVTIVGLSKIYNYWQADVNYATGTSLYTLNQPQAAAEYLLKAIELNPTEGNYYNQLSRVYAQLTTATDIDTKLANNLVNATKATSDIALQLNPHQLNFYRIRAQVLATLVPYDEKYIQLVKQTLADAIHLAPTDPKLVYNLAKVEVANQDIDAALRHFSQALDLKPDYYNARIDYAEALLAAGQPIEAKNQIEQLQMAGVDGPEIENLMTEINTQL